MNDDNNEFFQAAIVALILVSPFWAFFLYWVFW